ELIAVADNYEVRMNHAQCRVGLVRACAIRSHRVFGGIRSMQNFPLPAYRITSGERTLTIGGESANERNGEHGVLNQLSFAAIGKAAHPIRIGTFSQVQLLQGERQHLTGVSANTAKLFSAICDCEVSMDLTQRRVRLVRASTIVVHSVLSRIGPVHNRSVDAHGIPSGEGSLAVCRELTNKCDRSGIWPLQNDPRSTVAVRAVEIGPGATKTLLRAYRCYSRQEHEKRDNSQSSNGLHRHIPFLCWRLFFSCSVRQSLILSDKRRNRGMTGRVSVVVPLLQQIRHPNPLRHAALENRN